MYGHPGPPFLIAEDLVLLSLDPVSGRAAHSLRPQLLGGSIMVDLGLLGAVRTDRAGVLRRCRLVPVGPLPADPLLAGAVDRLGGRGALPREAGRWLGAGAHEAVLDRLATRGVVRRRETRSLGRRRAVWPSADTSRRDAVAHELVAMLLYGAAAPPRSVALAAVLARGGLLTAALPFPRGTRRSDLLPALEHHRASWGLDTIDVMDACVDSCSEGGSGGGDGGGWDGGGDSGGGGDGGGGGGGD